MTDPKQSVDLSKGNTVVVLAIIFAVWGAVVMLIFRDNVLFFHAELNLAIWMIGFSLSLLTILWLRRKWRKVVEVLGEQETNPFKTVALIGFSALIIAVLMRITADVAIDLANRTPFSAQFIVDDPNFGGRDCSVVIQLRDEPGNKYRLCAHRRFAFRSVQIQGPFAADDQVMAYGRKSWAGFAVDRLKRLD